MTTRSARGLTILVADDDPTIRSNLSLLLRSEGYTVREAVDGDEAAEALTDPTVVAALLDLKMPKQDGLAVLRGHADRVDEVPVIVVTAYGGSVAAIEAMKFGAYDYVTKPFDIDEVLFTLRRALTQRALIEQVHALSADTLAHELDPEEELIGRSSAMVSVFKMIGRIRRIRAEKKGSGRGAHASWAISHKELLRYQHEGLLRQCWECVESAGRNTGAIAP